MHPRPGRLRTFRMPTMKARRNLRLRRISRCRALRAARSAQTLNTDIKGKTCRARSAVPLRLLPGVQKAWRGHTPRHCDGEQANSDASPTLPSTRLSHNTVSSVNVSVDPWSRISQANVTDLRDSIERAEPGVNSSGSCDGDSTDDLDDMVASNSHE